MNKIIRYLFLLIFILSIYHLIRDIFQTIGINTWLTNFFHRPHQWCKPYCNYVTYPLDLFGIFGSLYELKRNKFDIIGKVLLISQLLWVFAVLLP